MHRMTLRLALLLSSLLLALACSSPEGGADAGATDVGTTDAGVDLGADLAEDAAPDARPDTAGPSCPGEGALVITELQIKPCEYDIEAEAEWFELYNPGALPIDIRGWTLRDSDSDLHVIPADAPVVVPAGGFFVLGASNVPGVDYVYGGIQLTNGVDDLSVLDGCETLVDTVAWDARWPERDCASLQLSSIAYDHLKNDDPRYWCRSQGGTGDPGSPGASNARCPGFCGDGETDPGELCDDGEEGNSDTEPDACRTDCRAPWCGDGVQDTDEQCDDGLEGNSDTEPDACRTDCRAAWCGDGVRDTDELCDDGAEGSESCSPACERLCTQAPGDIVLTEIMRNSADENDWGEYVEILNIATEAIDLAGCLLRDDDGERHEICVPSLIIEPGERLVLGRSGLLEENGGLTPDYVYGGFSRGGTCSGGSFIMGNTEDEVILECCGVIIDEVRYSDAAGWPDDTARAMSLAPEATDATANDQPENWCSAAETSAYGDGANRGTPGLPNDECYPSMDWCMVDHPSTAELRAGEALVVHGLFREPGATDVSTGYDPVEGLAIELGFGADGSLPDESWRWFPAAPNTAWQDAISPGADQYRGELVTSQEGSFDYAFRASLDNGAHWVYCDGRPLGSTDGYSALRAGQLTVLPSPCDPNPCFPPPADACEPDGVTLRDYSNAPGQCSPSGESYTCEYNSLLTDCALEGGRCLEGACVAYPHPAQGEVIFTEIMYDPHFDLQDANAEWFELFNNGSQAVTLNGCILRDAANHTTLIVGLSLQPMQYALFGRTENPALNGGLDVDHLFDFDLVNTGDRLILTCPDDSLNLQVVDEVAYDDGDAFPRARAASLSLSRNAYRADYNDNGANWCLGVSAYFTGSITPETDHLGTPGAPNPLCPAPDQEVDWCRLQGPLQLEALAGLPLSIAGRVFEQGITDRTDGVDPGPTPGMRGQLGYGLDGTSPTGAANPWTWVEAGPSPGWNAASVEPGVDEYTATFLAPAEGTYDTAFRFTRDNGVTWLYCDADTGLIGEDGSENGYQVANAGSLETLQSPCFPSPCAVPPDPICSQDGTTAIVFLPDGECSVEDNEPVCRFETKDLLCTNDGGHCADGDCVGGAGMPFAPGQVIFTEIMYNPHFDLSDTTAEWFEVYNVTDTPFYLEGCVVGDEGGGAWEITNLLLPPGGYGLFVASVNYNTNGNLFPDQTFNFALGNAGDSLYLECGDVLLDHVSYDVGGEYPAAEARSLSLHPAAHDADLNDLAANWCLASEVYYAGTGGSAQDNYGTPGEANPPCPVVDTQVDWCRLQWPLDVDVDSGVLLTVYGQVFEAGVTDASPAGDHHPRLRGQLGWGPAASDPSSAPQGWTWTEADINPEWVDDTAPGNDEYLASFTTPSAGSYDFAYRFSADGGDTWTYCDRDAGLGMDGSEDGYSPANAGQLITRTSPCESLDCSTPPTPSCAVDGVTLRSFSGPGVCEIVAGNAQCRFDEERRDCSLEGGVCTGGACFGLAEPPGVGDLVISEILYDPGVSLADAYAEWFELTNVSSRRVRLTDCTVSDAAGNQNVLTSSYVPVGGHALFVRSATNNGGLVPDHLFSFSLNNGGDTITLRCGETVIDTVTYTPGDGFPVAHRAALVLDPDFLDADDNDLGANWCVADARDTYYEGLVGEEDDHYGTPGAANRQCELPDFVVDWCRLHFPVTAVVSAGTAFTFSGRVFEQDITDRSSATDPDERLLAQGGWGPDGSQPGAGGAGWQWFDAEPSSDWSDGSEPGIDEYDVRFAAPAPGAYDYAFRFSLDEGENWLYCDRNAGLGQDGSVDGYSPANAGALTTITGPCDGYACDSPPAPACNDATRLIVYKSPGICELFSRQPRCQYDHHLVDCAESGGYCAAGVCTGGWEFPEAGDIVFTELMVDTEGSLLETRAEWVELRNVSARELQLEGCELTDTSTIKLIFDRHVLLPGEHLLAVRATSGNGGLNPDVILPFGLNNTGDTLNLRCGGQLIDTLTYDDGPGFPYAKRYSMSLDPRAQTASLNDVGANWCLASADDIYYFEGPAGANNHYGTPGELNPICPDADTTVDWCRLQSPASAELRPGDPLVVYGRLFELGLTDATTGVDGSPALRAQAGFGPDGSDPRVAGAQWRWASGAPSPGWNGNTALPVPEPDIDEYVATLPVPAEGVYDYAFRFSLDSGGTWLYCDLDSGAPGGDGSENGYSPDNAGDLLALEPESPCNPNPCLDPPSDLCAPDGRTLVTYDALGLCEIVEDAPVCSYPPILFDCGESGGVCEDGDCVFGPQPPLVGDVIVTEIMYDPRGDLLDAMAEWFEIHNPTTKQIDLDGCVVRDAGGASSTIYDFVLQPGAYALFGRTDFTVFNGGITPDLLFGFSLNNDFDSIILSCAGTVIDQVSYSTEAQFPVANGASLTLDPSFYDANANDQGWAWCLSETAYYVDPISPAGDNYGTPGEANEDCPEVDLTVDWCRLDRPLDETVPAGIVLPVFARVLEAGVTDLTGGFDPSSLLFGQVGYGPAGADPRTPGSGWTWYDASGVSEWDDTEAPGQDEYRGNLPTPAPGSYDFAFRFSRNAGLNWLYCDRDAGPGADGSEDGYAAANAGHLVTVANDCFPNPCDTPDPPECDADGLTVITYGAEGLCTLESEGFSCSYPESRLDCSLTGGTCAAGQCVGSWRAPAAGEAIFTEILYDPHYGLADETAEWFEIANLSADRLQLQGCTISEDIGASVTLGALVIEPGEHAVFARSADPALNGGLDPVATFSFALHNTAETLRLRCGSPAVLIDQVSYDEAGATPEAVGIALSLSADAYDATLNDEPSAWCLATDVFFVGDPSPERDNYGTPGALNPICPEIDPTVDWCRLQWPLDEVLDEGSELTVYGRVYDEGVTDQSSGTDPHPDLVAQVGFAPQGADPLAVDSDWTWFAAGPNPAWQDDSEPDNDEYMGSFPVPDPGAWDFAYRFSLDGGESWTYCDRDAGEGADGSEDGFSSVNAGHLTSLDSPCVPNPCLDAPQDTCEADGVTLSLYPSEGTCTVEGEIAACAYLPTEVDCSLDGGSCEMAACVGGEVPNFLISEYVEGSASNQAIEIFNAGNYPAELGAWSLFVYANGATSATSIIPLSAGSLASGGTYVLCHEDFALAATCDQRAAALGFDGDDAVGLAYGGVVKDLVGKIGEQPAGGWGSAPTNTQDATLRRDCAVSIGHLTLGADVFDPATQWSGHATDDVDDLGQHCAQ